MSWAQLREAGLTVDQIRSWRRSGELTWTRPRTYAVGPSRADLPARQWEAILYAGPGSALTGASAAHHLGWINFPPDDIQVTSPRKCRSLPGIAVSPNRPVVRRSAGRVPVTSTTEIMLDLAATMEFNVVRHAVEHLEYLRLLDVTALLGACRRGRPGSRRLRRALTRRLPGLSRCRSPLEVAFLLLCEANQLPLPKVNFRCHGIEVDMWWPELNLIVELDGQGNHGTAAQQRRDLHRTEVLGGHGLAVIRLGWADVHDLASTTVSALARQGLARRAFS